MKRGIKNTLLLVLLVLVFGSAFLFKSQLYGLFGGQKTNDAPSNLNNFDFNSFLEKVKKEISIPEPLKIFRNQFGRDLSKDGIISETNRQRQENGLKPLKENFKLNAAAAFKAKDIIDNQYFEHVSPKGIGPDGLAKQFGYDYLVIGENLILGVFSGDKEAVDDWMNSPGHRANILNAKYTEIGVGVLKGTYENQTVWVGVQEFGLPASACPSPSASLKSQIETMQNQLNSSSYAISSLKNEIDEIKNRNSEEYRDAVERYNQLVNDYNNLSLSVKSSVSQYNDQVNQYNKCIDK